MLKYFLLACSLLLGGCGSIPVERTVPFNEQDYAPFSHPGSGGIDAQMFLKTRGGRVVLGAGEEIICTPVTEYSSEYFEKTVLAGQPIKNAWDPAMSKYCVVQIGDAEGRAKFRTLPAGDWYVWGNVNWEVPRGSGYSTPEGSIAYSRVTVRDGQITEAVVTR